MQRRSAYGYALAAIGSVVLVGSLWLPWYRFGIPQSAIDQVVQRGHGYGAAGAFVGQGVELFGEFGAVSFNAWQLSTVIPGALLAVGVISGGLAVLVLSGRASGAGRVIASTGAAGVTVALYRYAVPVAPDDVFQNGVGVYVAISCAVVVAVGGLLALGDERPTASVTIEPRQPMPGTAEPWARQSVAPPARR